MGAAAKSGCVGGAKRTKSKTKYPNRDLAQRGLEWIVEVLGARREDLRVYECRYAPPGEPHFHVGHKPGETQKQYGRMPADGGNHRR
jgi:hypothetical protein